MNDMEVIPRKPTPPLGPQYFIQHRSYTVEEVVQSHDNLITLGFPPELVGRILDYAEFWVKESFWRRTPGDLVWCGPAEISTLYLQTGAIGSSSTLKEQRIVKPRRVIFRTNASNGGPFPIGNEGQYLAPGHLYETSWFDATIFRQDLSWKGGERTEPYNTLFDLKLAPTTETILWNGPKPDNQHMYYFEIDHLGEPGMENWGNQIDVDSLPPWLFSDPANKLKLRGGFVVVPNGTKQRWLVQRNSFGSGREDHIVDWTAEEDVEDEPWPLDGAGRGKGFVTSLIRGDKIAIWARTIGAHNEIKSVEVDVYHSIF